MGRSRVSGVAYPRTRRAPGLADTCRTRKHVHKTRAHTRTYTKQAASVPNTPPQKQKHRNHSCACKSNRTTTTTKNRPRQVHAHAQVREKRFMLRASQHLRDRGAGDAGSAVKALAALQDKPRRTSLAVNALSSADPRTPLAMHPHRTRRTRLTRALRAPSAPDAMLGLATLATAFALPGGAMSAVSAQHSCAAGWRPRAQQHVSARSHSMTARCQLRRSHSLCAQCRIFTQQSISAQCQLATRQHTCVSVHWTY